MDEDLAVDGEGEADAEGLVEGDHVLVQIHPGQRPRLFEPPGHGEGDGPGPTPGPKLGGATPKGGAEGSRTAEEEGERSGHGDGRDVRGVLRSLISWGDGDDDASSFLSFFFFFFFLFFLSLKQTDLVLPTI